MGIHSRHTRILAVVGVLALGAASTVRAQETTNAPPKDTSAARSDTSGYQSYQNPPDTIRLKPIACGRTAPASSTTDRRPIRR